MTKDEELKEAIQWYCKKHESDLAYLNSFQVAKLLLAYHHHRLDTAWVSVKERLPEPGRYLANISGLPFFKVMELRFIDGCWIDEESDYYWNKYVTHWQPLPEPPKEK